MQAADFAARHNLKLIFARGPGPYGQHLDIFEPATFADCRVSPAHYDVATCPPGHTCLTTAESTVDSLVAAVASSEPMRIYHGVVGDLTMEGCARPVTRLTPAG